MCTSSSVPISPGTTNQAFENGRRFLRAAQSALALMLLILCGCEHYSYNIPRDSYTLLNRFYTFAIYNDAGRLLTHPLLDLERALETASIDGHGCSNITDIYVMAHGWNYSAGEAVANYHNYIELLDRLRDEKRHSDSSTSETFCPYLILVAWTSTTRPVEDVANSILPLNMGEAVRPIGAVTDKLLLHPLTAWKQSFRAASIALGTRYPDSYVYRPWYRTDTHHKDAVKEYGTESPYFLDSDTGYDAPVSAMLYELIKWKVDPKPTGPSLRNIPIHLVGHSYGAKLVVLAGMEALRRWVLVDHLLGESFGPTEREKLDNLERAIEYRRPFTDNIIRSLFGFPKKQSDNTDVAGEMQDHWFKLLQQTGHGFGPPTIFPNELLLPRLDFEHEACETIETVIVGTDAACKNVPSTNTIQPIFPISSLVLINPALHPGELWYPVNAVKSAPAATLRLIPRKAIIYSKSDYATGILFNMRESIIDVQGAQRFQFLFDNSLARAYATDPGHSVRRMIGTPLTSLLNGPIGLGYSLIHGGLLYVGTTAINLPHDLWYHVQSNHPQVEWLPEWLKWDAPKNRLSVGSFMGRAANLVDFFIPLVPFGPTRDEDLQGIFRLSRPALGKTGIVKLAAGRPNHPNLYGLSTFYDSNNAPNISTDKVCGYLGQEPHDSNNITNTDKLRAAIFSFDASKVYDSKMPPAGAHDDIRDRSTETSCLSGTPSSKELGVLNGLLAEAKTRLRTHHACANSNAENDKIACEDLTALHSLDIVSIKGNTWTVAISPTPFQDGHRRSSDVELRIKEFWNKIKIPLANELASEYATRLGSSSPFKLTLTSKKEKRELSFDFVLGFTKGLLDDDLLDTLPSGPN